MIITRSFRKCRSSRRRRRGRRKTTSKPAATTRLYLSHVACWWLYISSNHQPDRCETRNGRRRAHSLNASRPPHMCIFMICPINLIWGVLGSISLRAFARSPSGYVPCYMSQRNPHHHQRPPQDLPSPTPRHAPRPRRSLTRPRAARRARSRRSLCGAQIAP